jgi:hypothetical protein
MAVEDSQLGPFTPTRDAACPECGADPDLGAAFCVHCGTRLGSVQQPAPAEPRAIRESEIHTQARQIAQSLQGIAPMQPLRSDTSDTASVVTHEITRAIDIMIHRAHRSLPVTVEPRYGTDGTVITGATARIKCSDGSEVEQSFRVTVPATTLRMQISLDQHPVFVADGARASIPVVEQNAYSTMAGAASTARATPHAAAPTSGMSDADARELAGRRAADAAQYARLHGWKPLTLWYTFWAVLIGIGAITAFAHGEVGAGFIALVLLALCAKYVHYLYHGGRRRVWFVIW